MNYGTFIEPVLAEYPRVNNEKFYTDKYLLHIISNQCLYQRIFKSVDKALQYFNVFPRYIWTRTYTSNHGNRISPSELRHQYSYSDRITPCRPLFFSPADRLCSYSGND